MTQSDLCHRADSVPQLSRPKSYLVSQSHPERAGLPGVLTHQRSQVRSPLLPKYQSQVGPAQSPQDPGTSEQPERVAFWFLSMPRPDPVPQKFGSQSSPAPQFHSENRSSRSANTPKITRVLTHLRPQAYRLIGGRSSSQRWQKHLSPKITR